MAANILYHHLGRQRNDRIFRERRDPLIEMTSEEVRSRYRFSKESIRFIADLIRARIEPSTRRSQAISTELQLLVALRFYATGSFQQVLGDTVGVEKSTVCRIVRRVSLALNELLPTYVQWPTTERKKEIKAGFFQVAGFPSVIGCIDGTHVRIQAPSVDEAAFVNRKRYHSINTQAVCDHEGKFIDVVARWGGSTHDSHIFRTSPLKRRLEEHRGLQDGVILGDSGYACKPYLMTPYLRPSTEPQERFNTAHKRTRTQIERAFGWLKRRFHVLHGEIRMEPERVCTIIGACVVLHNLAILLREPQPQDDAVDDQQDDEMDDAEPEYGDDGRQGVSTIMLRSVILENFVGFKDKQTVNINESPSILVGENGSGKSSFLEGIRRCQVSNWSTTRSSVYDETQPSYVVCKYDTSICDEAEIKKVDPPYMFTGTVTQDKETYFKFVSTDLEIIIDKRQKADGKLVGQFYSDDDTKKLFDDLLQNIFDPMKITTRTFTAITDGSKVEKRLDLLGKYVVMTFPLRSIGPLQWSKSERIAEDQRQKNYLESSQRAEIIKYFLQNQNQFDLERENSYFSGLTGRNDIQFELGGEGNILVKSTEALLPGGEFALLKTPEGILEAKHFSILMSNKTFRTLIFEEPDRGMHSQMVERMMSIILKEKENKVIILSTHNQRFVNLTTICCLSIFRRIHPAKNGRLTKVRNEIISGADIAKRKGEGLNSLRFLTRGHFADLIFATKVLFCEGDSDFLFLTALKELIVKPSDGILRVLKLINGSDDAQLVAAKYKLQNIAVSLQIISIDGWDSGKKAKNVHDLCDELKIDAHYFLCDKDAVIDYADKMKDRMNDSCRWMDPQNIKTIETEFNSGERDEKALEKVRNTLRDEFNCFIWRDGTIEDMLISLLRSDTEERSLGKKPKYDCEMAWCMKGEVIRALENQQVFLPIKRWKDRRYKIRNQAKEADQKLFLSPKVTQENVIKSVEIFLNACDDLSDDLVQFVNFLLNMKTT